MKKQTEKQGKMKVQEYIERAYRTAVLHGFHSNKYGPEHLLMLMITEISEVIEADRKKRHTDGMNDFLKREDIHPDYMERYDTYIKGTIAEELADVCIRVFDFMGEYNMTETMLNAVPDMEIREEFAALPLTVQAYYTVCFIVSTDNQLINCKGLLSFAERLAKLNNIDLDWHIQAKMRYNEERPMLHGKRY